MSDIRIEALKAARYSYLEEPLTALNIEAIKYLTTLIKAR